MKDLFSRFWSPSISSKVILPYLILTLAVAIVGTYVVTNLVTSSLSERLTNQLLEAGRNVSDSLARQEIEHLEVARVAAFTRGLDQALLARDQAGVSALAQPIVASRDIECMIVLDAEGNELLHVLKQEGDTLELLTGQFDMSGLWIAQAVLASGDPNSLPKRALGSHPLDQRYYYFTAVPIGQGEQLIGVVVVGTSLNTLLPYFKATSLADIIIYLGDGSAVASTFALPGNSQSLPSLSMSPLTYLAVLNSDDSISGENIQVHNRQYRIARGPLRVSNDKLGVFAVALPLNFILQTNATSRNTYVLLSVVVMVSVVCVGYLIAKRITQPISLLVHTSQIVAEGDLSRRTGLAGQDEIGKLAATFDTMTERLAERTHDLEKAYRTLEQLDKTKSDFIEVAAHELRTPLTLVKGYAQLLESTLDKESESASWVHRIDTGAVRMQEVVSSMLDVTRIDSQSLDVCAEPMAIATLIMGVLDEFELALQERNLTAVVEGVEDLPLIEADANLLYKAFYQLIVNAIKYTPDGGSISVNGRLVVPSTNRPAAAYANGSGEFEPGCVEIVISDTGIGIDSEHHELIFEKFYQTGQVSFHSSGKTKFKGGGPGLGLAIARGVVLAHRGQIWVESNGQDEQNCPGSRFYVRLPIKRIA